MLKIDINWPPHRQFKSKTENEPLDFFSECLCNSIRFDLMLGYFSSTAIQILSDGFASFLYAGGNMRLIINNVLSGQDKDAIVAGLDGEFDEPFNLTDIEALRRTLSYEDKHFFECLAWLISNKRIDIKTIAPKGTIGISHTKSGVFFDGQNSVAFNGSCNFTKSALVYNIESIDAFCDWDDPVNKAKVDHTLELFEKTFNEQDNEVDYIDPHNIVTEISNQFGGKEIEELLQQEKQIIEKRITPKLRPSLSKVLEKAKKHTDKLINQINKERELPRFPFNSEPREYQKIAFENWKNNKQQGLFAMATGTGKTITSLNCLLEIYKRNEYYKAIILVPTITLLDQWVKECKKFNFQKIVKVYSKNRNWKNEIDELRLSEKISGKDNKLSYVIISTYASFAKENVFNLLNEFPQNKLLLIADEAHNMGSGQIRNRLSAIKYIRRIGLSATPERQFDDEGNYELFKFFGASQNYTYEFSMEEAINSGFLCRYYYYQHLVKLTDEEMIEYSEISSKIAKFYSTSKEGAKSDNPFLTALLLKRKRIIHKARNKKEIFKQILENRYEQKGNLKYTLVYVPEGTKPDDESDLFGDREQIEDDLFTDNLIDEYTRIVRDIDKKVTVKQFKSGSTGRDDILEDFALGKLDVLTSMKCLDEGVDVPRSELAIFCASTGNPRQFIQRRGRILRTHNEKHIAEIHDLVVAPELNPDSDSYNLEKSLLKSELKRVNNFSLLSENSSDTINELENILQYYNLSIF